MFCTNCGKQMPDDARFCPACGTPAAGAAIIKEEKKPEPAQAASPEPITKEKKRKAGKKSLGDKRISVKTLLKIAGAAFLIYFIYASDLYFLIFELFPEEPYTETYIETDPPETEPVPETETDPPETKSKETKAPETKPKETKPAETKPKETKPAETKPKETKAPETKAPEASTASGIPPLNDKSIPASAIGGKDNPDPEAFTNKRISGTGASAGTAAKPSDLPDVKTRIQALLAEDNYSRQVVIGRMQNEGYTESDIIPVLDSMGIDWKAVAHARINKIHFPGAASRTEYRKQLKGHKFTDEETEYVISQFDWKAIAVDRAGWVRISAWSYEEAYDQMIAEGFTPEEASHGLAQHYD